jgi:hypothetical protein
VICKRFKTLIISLEVIRICYKVMMIIMRVCIVINNNLWGVERGLRTVADGIEVFSNSLVVGKYA